jgi:hypothetical protein
MRTCYPAEVRVLRSKWIPAISVRVGLPAVLANGCIIVAVGMIAFCAAPGHLCDPLPERNTQNTGHNHAVQPGPVAMTLGIPRRVAGLITIEAG